MNLVCSTDYHLSGFFYFTSRTLSQIRKRQQVLLRFLKNRGFEEYHFPFLVPNELLEKYKGVISKKNYLKVFSGKNKRAFYFMRPQAIFCQSLPLASTLIKSYKDLPLKMLEASPEFKEINLREKVDLLNTPEESFGIQGAMFSENGTGEIESYLLSLSRSVLRRFGINKFRIGKKNIGRSRYVEFYVKENGRKIALVRLFDLRDLICRKAHIYYFNDRSQPTFPKMHSFSFSQNILLLGKNKNR